MKDSKQIVYRYDGAEKSDNVVEDLDGEIQIPKQNDLIVQNGKRWKVVHIVREQTGRAIPVYRIFLSSSI